jgi:hypothetical protein
MKAWWAECIGWEEDGGHFVWADTPGKARKKGVAELNADDITQVRVKRVPSLDGERRCLTAHEVMAAGYGANCETCGGHVYEYHDEASIGPNGEAYCQSCTEDGKAPAGAVLLCA